jgi:phosphatidylglycerophosphatase C
VARLAVFDLDGTLTRRDTLAPYVVGLLARRPWQLLRLVHVMPALIAFALRGRDRGKLKARLLRATLAGRSRSEIQAWTARFVPRLLAKGLHGEALATLERHRASGDVLVLLSASPDLYVPAIGAELGFHEVICTQIAWRGDRLEGGLRTANRRGKEKTRCLERLRERYPELATSAYANAASDLDHLTRVDEPLLVNGSPAARRAAARLGIASARWP